MLEFQPVQLEDQEHIDRDLTHATTKNYDAFKDSVGIFELVLVSQERFKKTESVFFRRSKRKSCTAVANS